MDQFWYGKPQVLGFSFSKGIPGKTPERILKGIGKGTPSRFF